ncbi:hypothetical protein FHT82_001715 [Rhizobium sp. BK275]|nr:hypothetical protein [Rhizobium sp. BK275]
MTPRDGVMPPPFLYSIGPKIGIDFRKPDA